ncbi:hypothetical protein SAMN04488034_101711 [Salinimicrobium catena]|uniref:SET domain-containing protein n=1 Tax=Salinimicrobium catena TaxID=390640 RepID=A0A1H5JEA3_9FLAO|nr:SET domain-containing protein [Salinimicrobium catena]SDK86976.1 hypothetical protein SAMN04488140_101710 [Salinimicrobium catena]SEE50784.1 hypothetical protein SAMN04488034_101711 [Salinimicrobium catena]
MMHPHTEVRFISKEIGHGVVATRFIPRGTITWVQDELDRVLTPAEVEKMRPQTRELVDKYSFRNNKGHFVLCWDLSKYVNHSFRSNCLSTAYDFELAVRDINEGEQLTDDYGYLNVVEPFKALDEGAERDTVYPDDLLRYHQEWDAQLFQAFRHFKQVEQPLLSFVPQKVLENIRQKLNNNEPLDSILNLYCGEIN